MNWLAHFVLSPPQASARLGSWLPDLFPPALLAGLPDPDFQRGAQRHHQIDFLTDRHPSVLAARDRMPRELRRAAGIVLDVYWDHFLSVEFEVRTGRTLEAFVKDVLDDLERVVDMAPPGTREVLARMRAEAWLTSYQTPEGVELTLGRISRRLSAAARRCLPPRVAHEHLLADHDRLARDFGSLWRDVTTAVAFGPLAAS